MMTANLEASENNLKPVSNWQSLPAEVLEVMHTQEFPRVWTAPTGEYMLLADPVLYPSLAELAAPMHKLAGIRVNPAINAHHGRRGSTSPRLVRLEDRATIPLDLPTDAEVYSVSWTADGQRFALTVKHTDHIGLWIGSVKGNLEKLEGIALNPLMGN
ncbi:MAG: hypothetical protein AAF808_12070, partial [Cyanobacteria bacterium P01_D01_bin.2]